MILWLSLITQPYTPAQIPTPSPIPSPSKDLAAPQPAVNPSPQVAPSPDSSVRPSPQLTPSASPLPTSSPSASPQPTVSPSPQLTPSPSPSVSPQPTISPSPQPTPSSSPSNPLPTVSPSPKSTVSPSPKPQASPKGKASPKVPPKSKIIKPESETQFGHFAYKEAKSNELTPIGGDGLIKLRKAAAKSYLAMATAARAQGITLFPISGFRSIVEQKYVFFAIRDQRGQKSQERARVSAPPGYSEHHTGYAIDIGDAKLPEHNLSPSFAETPAFKWLRRKAAKYNFELSFPENNTQGINYEPWHWRFVGDVNSLSTFARARTAAAQKKMKSPAGKPSPGISPTPSSKPSPSPTPKSRPSPTLNITGSPNPKVAPTVNPSK
jgi:zinc D-Ala-D-Ala carboxypeptidase